MCVRRRPQVQIEEERLTFLIERGFRINDITALFGCCRRRVERRLNEFNPSAQNYSLISDAQLDEEVMHISSLHPQCGEKTVHGRLKSKGYQCSKGENKTVIR